MSTATPVSLGKKDAQPITVTDAAITKAVALLAAENPAEPMALRIDVIPGGCSGFKYDMYFDSEFSDDDVISMHGDLKVALDEESAKLLVGASLDYSDNLNGAGFHVTNPNATRTCGCGNSFS